MAQGSTHNPISKNSFDFIKYIGLRSENAQLVGHWHVRVDHRPKLGFGVQYAPFQGAKVDSEP